MEPETGFEPVTSSLPRRRSTPELLGRDQRPRLLKVGAGDEARTRDPQLGRLMLYQLSYSRPGNDELGTMNDELKAFSSPFTVPRSALNLVQGVGFEPT